MICEGITSERVRRTLAAEPECEPEMDRLREVKVEWDGMDLDGCGGRQLGDGAGGWTC